MDNNFRYTYTAFISFLFSIVATVFLFPVLYRFSPAGISIPIVVGAFYAALLTSMRGRYSLKRGGSWQLFIPIGLCSLQFVFFNNGLLSFLNLIAIALMLSIQISLMTGMRKTLFGNGIFSMEIHMIFVRPFHKIGALFANAFAYKNKQTKKAIGGILAGFAVTLPILAIMLLLLTSADIVFAEFITNIFSWKSMWRVIYFIVLVGIGFTTTGSFIVSLKEKAHTRIPRVRKHITFNFAAVYILASTLSILMIFFSAFQLIYLTGLSELPYNFDYSTYARQGFFQMLAAAALVFFVITICYRHTREAEGLDRLILNILYTVLSVTVMVLLVSSFSRMVLYEQVYRFTRLRLYTQAFTILLGVFCIFTIIKIWRPKFRITKFIFYASAFALILLTYFNVDGFIAKDAAKHAEKTGEKPDIAYLSTLSEDALPYYCEYIDPAIFELSDPDDYIYNTEEHTDYETDEYYAAANLAHYIDDTMSTIEKEDFRTYNTTRHKLYREFPEDVLQSARNMILREHDNHDF